MKMCLCCYCLCSIGKWDIYRKFSPFSCSFIFKIYLKLSITGKGCGSEETVNPTFKSDVLPKLA